MGSDVEDAIRGARATGKGIRKIARELGVGVSKVQRVVRLTTGNDGRQGNALTEPRF